MEREDIKTNTIIGTCKFCGQQQAVEAYNQEVAHERATANCKCEEGKMFRKKEECLEYIMDICQAPASDTGVKPLPSEYALFVRQAGDLVALKALQKVTIDYMDTTITLRPGTEDKPVKFSRSWKLEIEN